MARDMTRNWGSRLAISAIGALPPYAINRVNRSSGSQDIGQEASLVGVVALYIDQQLLLRECRKDLVQRRHQSDAASTEWKRLAFIGRVTITNIELLEFGKRVRSRLAAAIRAAVKRPIMKDRKTSVRRGMHVEFDNIGAKSNAACIEAIVFSR
jgi:hypothetical protein